MATLVGGKCFQHYAIPCSPTFHSWWEGKWTTKWFPSAFRRSYTRQTATKILRQQCWNEVLTIRNNVAALWCTENRSHDLSEDGEEEETNNATRAIALSGTFLSRPWVQLRREISYKAMFYWGREQWLQGQLRTISNNREFVYHSCSRCNRLRFWSKSLIQHFHIDDWDDWDDCST